MPKTHAASQLCLSLSEQLQAFVINEREGKVFKAFSNNQDRLQGLTYTIQRKGNSVLIDINLGSRVTVRGKEA